MIRGGAIPLTGLTPPHFCGCPKPESGFLTSDVVAFFVCVCVCVQWFEVMGVVVRFVDIDRIVDHHLLFII